MRTHCLKDIDVVILAGGFGTRLAEMLDGKPKLLAPIGGKPYLDFLLKWLVSFGARRIILALGHLAQEIEDYSNATFKGRLEIICAREPRPLGTAGALAFASVHIKSSLALVMNGDSFVDADLCKLIHRHNSFAGEATILCTRVANAGRYGSIKITKDGYVESFREKAEIKSSGMINAGIYVVSGNTVERVRKIQHGSLEKDVFQILPVGALNTFSGNFNFLDIGTPEDYERAQEFFQPFMRRWRRVKL